MEDPLDFTKKDTPEDLHIGYKILGFLVPIAGIIMYFKHRETNPTKAKQASTAAILGIILGIVIRVMESAIQ